MSDLERAFPNTGNSTWGMDPELGMTLRDYFAGQAIESLVAVGISYDEAEVATDAYRLADAMLAARALGKEG